MPIFHDPVEQLTILDTLCQSPSSLNFFPASTGFLPFTLLHSLHPENPWVKNGIMQSAWSMQKAKPSLINVSSDIMLG